MQILCLDLEGVLIPEIWQAVAQRTGIEALQQTTRDIPVYDDLMQMRLRTMAEHDVRLSLIQDVIGTLAPLPGAADFLAWARPRFQVAILSDTFYPFAAPLMAKLGWPLLLCHQLVVEDDRIVGYRLRQEDPKRHSVLAFQSLTYRVLAAGDSYNDLSMLQTADFGCWFDAPASIRAEYPELAAAADYQSLQEALSKASAALGADA
jgi:phosphoserine/homoserine phosphotransferase